MRELRKAAADLILGTRCAGCDAAGHLVCADCRRDLRPRPRVCWPDPPPLGLVEPQPVVPTAASDYDGVVRSVLLEFKEHGRYPLLPHLADLLVAAIWATPTGRAPLLLVPMPSRRAAVRERGYDAVALLAGRSASLLRRRGRNVRMAPILRHRGVVVDQAGLNASERQQNLAGSLATRARPAPGRLVVVVDDVITTGASMAEAVASLRACGVHPAAVAAACATRKQIHSGKLWRNDPGPDTVEDM